MRMDMFKFYTITFSLVLSLAVIVNAQYNEAFQEIQTSLYEVDQSTTVFSDGIIAVLDQIGAADYETAFYAASELQGYAQEYSNYYLELMVYAEDIYQATPEGSAEESISIFYYSLANEGAIAFNAWQQWLQYLQQTIQTGSSYDVTAAIDQPLSEVLYLAENHEQWMKVFRGEATVAELDNFLTSRQETPNYTYNYLEDPTYSVQTNENLFAMQQAMMQSMHDTSMNIISGIGGGCYGVDTNGDGYCD